MTTTTTATKAKTRFVLPADLTGMYTPEQKAWLGDAYKTIVRILKRQATFHVDDFWKSFKGGEYPRAHSFDLDSRVLGYVFRQVAKDGHMSVTEYAKKVTYKKNASYYRPIWSSNLFVPKDAS